MKTYGKQIIEGMDMRWAKGFTVLVLVGIIWGMGVFFYDFYKARRMENEELSRVESQVQKMARLRAMAPVEMLKDITNQVVGLHRIINTQLSTRDSLVAKWKGEATVEFVNRVGGIERTNLFFIFRTYGGSRGDAEVLCSRDFFRDEAEAKVKREAWLKGLPK